MKVMGNLGGFGRRATVVLGACLAIAAGARDAGAWGRVGHRTCGKLTEFMLDAKVKAELKKLLEEGESLADASTWADENRDLDRGSASWHYVNVPLSAAAYDPKYCSDRGCVVSKIHEMKRTLADKSKPVAARRKALRYLVHFVQDLHQPVHVGDNRDKGGNDLQLNFMGSNTNLHSLWDSGLLSKIDRNEDRHLARLKRHLTPEQQKEWSRGTVEDWATESLIAAKSAYLNPTTKARLKPGDRLDAAYLDANAATVDRRLTQAAVRLASILNETLK